MASRITLKTLSERLGISQMAVSKAINGKPGVSEDTRSRVLALAEELNYRPNRIAQSLRLSETKTLGLVIADSTMSLFAPIIDGVEKTAAEYGYQIILVNARSNAVEEQKAVRTLVGKRIDGMLLAASMLTDRKHKKFLAEAAVPYLYLVRRCNYKDGDYVVSDNVASCREMVGYLLDKGAPVHFLNLPAELTTAGDRLLGYKQAFEDKGRPCDERLVYNIKPTISAGYEKTKRLLDGGENLHTVFCGCDMIAVGVMQALRERGLSVPKDVWVASHDDIEMAQHLGVPLTTIRAPLYDIAALGTRELIEKIQSGSGKRIRIALPSSPVFRDSA
ncbi:MAG: LacI family transcriptional regulator [Clostridiales bacterium]|nr:LacI family transcriptional regulator [Clostridiales bacterium]